MNTITDGYPNKYHTNFTNKFADSELSLIFTLSNYYTNCFETINHHSRIVIFFEL